MIANGICQYCHALKGTTNEVTTKKDNENEQSGPKSCQPHNDLGNVIGKALIIGGAVVALPCLALTIAGFGAAGIVGGSIAAATQSAIGNVAAGSLFATLQSVGATGLLVNGAAAGGVAAAAGAITATIQNIHNRNQNKKESSKNKDDGKGMSGHTNEPANTTLRFCPFCGRKLTGSTKSDVKKLPQE